jgi:3',5'-cyclic-AMP phosphodiesterase
MRPFPTLATIALLSLAPACFSTPGERAAIDLTVGHASIQGATLDIDGGTAVVRELSAGRLALWCSAPVWSAQLEVDAPADWVITLDNALSDATLVAMGPNGHLDVLKELGSRPTQHHHRVTLPAGVTRLSLVTPDHQDRGAYRIALMSDIQDAVDDVSDMFAAIEEEPGVRFLLGAGDLAQNGSRGELIVIQRELEGFALPYYTTLGNHDIAEVGAFQDLFGRGNIHFQFRGVHFTLLDSAAASIEPMVYDWIAGWLEDGRSATHVVSMHIPPLDPVGTRNGAFGSRHEAGKLLKRLASGGVDLTVYGHIHSYYSFDNAGIPALISGGGGAIPERLDGIGRHFVVIDLGGDDGVVDTRVVEVD